VNHPDTEENSKKQQLGITKPQDGAEISN